MWKQEGWHVVWWALLSICHVYSCFDGQKYVLRVPFILLSAVHPGLINVCLIEICYSLVLTHLWAKYCHVWSQCTNSACRWDARTVARGPSKVQHCSSSRRAHLAPSPSELHKAPHQWQLCWFRIRYVTLISYIF